MSIKSIEVRGKYFVSDYYEYFNLNAIWNELELPKSKRPECWKGRCRDLHEDRNNIVVEEEGVGRNKTITTYATYAGTLGYLMNVDDELYFDLLDALEANRRG